MSSPRRLLLLNQQFRIPEHELPTVRAAVLRFATTNSQFAGDAEFVEMARRAESLDELLSLWGWVPRNGANGDVTFLDHDPEDVIVASTVDEDTNLFGALAPFVEDGFLAVAVYHHHENQLPFWHAWKWVFSQHVCSREVIPVPWSVEELPSLLAPAIKAWRDTPKDHQRHVYELLRTTIFNLGDRAYAGTVARALALLLSAQTEGDTEGDKDEKDAG